MYPPVYDQDDIALSLFLGAGECMHPSSLLGAQ